MGHCMLSKLSGTPLKPFLKKGFKNPKNFKSKHGCFTPAFDRVTCGAKRYLCCRCVAEWR